MVGTVLLSVLLTKKAASRVLSFSNGVAQSPRK